MKDPSKLTADSMEKIDRTLRGMVDEESSVSSALKRGPSNPEESLQIGDSGEFQITSTTISFDLLFCAEFVLPEGCRYYSRCFINFGFQKTFAGMSPSSISADRIEMLR
jgi:hypothetical protein